MHDRFEKRIEEALKKIAEGAAAQAPAEAHRDRSAGGETAGAGTRGRPGPVRGAHRYGGERLGPVAVAEGRAVAGLGTVERRLLPAAQQRDGLGAPRISGEPTFSSPKPRAAFRIHKSDLDLRPVWHQKQERVEAHILVCFLAYVLWKTLAQICHTAGAGLPSEFCKLCVSAEPPENFSSASFKTYGQTTYCAFLIKREDLMNGSPPLQTFKRFRFIK